MTHTTLDADLIRASLPGRFGVPLRVLATTGSTNTDALDWAAEGAPEGALVVADHQSEGRGRHGRMWFSEPGRVLLFSLVLRPHTSERISLLSTVAGIGACEALRSATNLSVLLKWPNDVMVGDRKLCGLLVETRSEPSGELVAVLGVGLNVSWRRDELPVPIADDATSVAAEMDRAGLGTPPPRERLLAGLIGRIEERYEQLRLGETRDLITTATSLSSLIGRDVVVRVPAGEEVTGMVTGLDDQGRLEVETPVGARVLAAGEVETVRRT